MASFATRLRPLAVFVLVAAVSGGCDPGGMPSLPDNWVLARRDGQVLTIEFVACEPLAIVTGVEIDVFAFPDGGKPGTHTVARYVGESAPTFPLELSTKSSAQMSVIDPAGVQSLLDGATNVDVHIDVLLADGSEVSGSFWAESLADVQPGEFNTIGGSVPRDGLCERETWPNYGLSGTDSTSGAPIRAERSVKI